MMKINVQPEGSFPVFCAWCGRVCDYSTVMGSHGICRLCRVEAEKETEEQFICLKQKSGRLILKNQEDQ